MTKIDLMRLDDLWQVLSIENQCFDQPWSESDFLRFICFPKSVCIVIFNPLQLKLIDGYLVCAMNGDRVIILNLATDPECRRNGVATALIDNLKWRMGRTRRTTIEALVCETNLAGQLFFQSAGFSCTEIVRQPYQWDRQDGYKFEFVKQRKPITLEQMIDV